MLPLVLLDWSIIGWTIRLLALMNLYEFKHVMIHGFVFEDEKVDRENNFTILQG